MTEDRVTLRDIYTAVNRIEDKFDKRIEDIEKNVDTLKAFQNKAMATLSVFSSLVGLGSSYFWKKITG